MKIHIMGAAGSGVTTLGKSLSARLQIPYFDSDAYFWIQTDPPFTTRRSPEERNRMALADLRRQDSWIFGGSVINWGDEWSRLFDVVVFLYLPREIRIARLQQREMERYGAINKEFIDWAAGYDDDTASGRTLSAHRKWIKQLPCQFMELNGDLTVELRVAAILGRMG
jgi:adenylate kinase family enzyme